MGGDRRTGHILPLALDKDPTFGLKLPALGRALAARAETCEDTITRNACISLAYQIKEVT